MTSVDQGAWVWVEDVDEKYLPARALTSFLRGDATKVRTEDGEDRKLSGEETKVILDCNMEALSSNIDDLCNISDLNEMSILHNLRIRYKEDKIYTNVSSILISVNPFRLLPLYTPEMLDKYKNSPRDLPPHVFATAYNAYAGMVNAAKDQAVVCSGESGAGKSEATKLILQFLTDASGSAHGHVEGGKKVSSVLEQQILAANPILEAFGNAKTLRNNNSSRFGKLITVNFDAAGTIVGGGIINYLLEKSRVVYQTKGERNYHIFYQILTLIDTQPKLAEELQLKDAELFNITGNSGAIHIDGINDEKEFEDVNSSFSLLNFSEDEKKSILNIVAGVLHVSNAVMIPDPKPNAEDGSKVDNLENLAFAAGLWGTDPDDTARYLTHKNIGSRSFILVDFSVEQANAARDAIVKRVYGNLFQFVVDKINSVLGKGGSTNKRNIIGVLDIFGFESFDVNSFEQLCINYCNEKLQFHFNEHIFSMEQALYAKEGIHISDSSFVDNQPTLDLLELKGTGIFAMCDEEISVPKGSDEGFLSKMIRRYGEKKPPNNHPNFLKPGPRDCLSSNNCFGILHYAGPVYYNVNAFLEKNKDTLSDDLTNLLKASTLPLMQKLFPADVEDASAAPPGRARGGASRKKKQTLGGQFKNQLTSLVDTLNSAEPHFVRCMKPNDQKVGNLFDSQRMLDQLRYAGLLEVCRIRKLGYPIRWNFDEFYKRFKCIEATCGDLDSLCKAMGDKGVLKAGEWAKGNTKLFMRMAQSQDVELAREDAIVKVVIAVQKAARRFIGTTRYRRWKGMLASMSTATAAQNRDELQRLCDLAAELPFGGAHLPQVKAAKAMLARLAHEARAKKALEEALASNEIHALRAALGGALPPTMDPPLESPLVARAQEAIKLIERHEALATGLKAAMDSRDKAKLSELLSASHAEGFNQPIVSKAASLLEVLQEEDRVLQELEAAVSAANWQNDDSMDKLSQCMSAAVNLGLQDKINHAQATYADLNSKRDADKQRREAELLKAQQERRKQEEAGCTKRLEDAMASTNAEALNSAIEYAIKLGLTPATSDALSRAQDFSEKIAQRDDLVTGITSAVSTFEAGPMQNQAITEKDLEPVRTAVELAAAFQPTSMIAGGLANGKKKLERFEQIVNAEGALKVAVTGSDLDALRVAVNNAQDLDMRTDALKFAEQRLKEGETSRREEAAQSTAAPVAAEDYDKAEKARILRHEIARQPRFSIKNFPALRSPDDFAKGLLFTKASIKEGFLQFSKDVIPKSMTDLNRELNKVAVAIFKDLLGYMGDKQMTFPAMLAHDILTKGFHNKEIRDEIYLQIIKQITKNGRNDSSAKGWQMMCLCAGTFPPSVDFENFLLHFILHRYETSRGAVRDYARYCLRTVDGMLAAGDASGFVPSVNEIQAYKERPPILATIELVDGNIITEALPVTPDLNVGKVLKICTGWLALSDPRAASLGIFVYDMGSLDGEEDTFETSNYERLPRSPRPLRNSEYMGDVIVQKSRQRRRFKFVLKKKIFLEKDNYCGDDDHYERLVYLQAEDEAIIQGNLPIDSIEEATTLTTLSMVIGLGEEFPQDSASLLEEGDGGQALVLDYVPPDWRDECDAEEWATTIFNEAQGYLEKPVETMQRDFVKIVSQSPVYGTHWFFAMRVSSQADQIKELPWKLILGYNADGLHIFSSEMEFKMSFSYGEIYRWGGSASQFCIILFDSAKEESFDLVVATAQASDMASVIMDHIEALLVAKQKDEATVPS